MKFKNDYNGFTERHSDFLKDYFREVEYPVPIVFQPIEKGISVIGVESSPFASNPITGLISYDSSSIEKCALSPLEEDACIMHELGHFLYHYNVFVKNSENECSESEKEKKCDNVVVEADLAISLLSALCKMQEKIDVNLNERISSLAQNIKIYRPEWTCGRYNKEKKAAIMYNLIAGYSYYFEGYSATVIAEIFKVGRNEDVDVVSISSATGISIDSLSQFFVALKQCGLLVETIPTQKSIEEYRKIVLETRKANESWLEKPTEEKLPMDVTNAEQAYFSTVDDGKTICSCMFELTYRCSELCIHCYNPGATRNSTEQSHRADQKELTLDDYKCIIDDMYNNGLVKVCLSGGDPFSKEFVWDLLDYLYEKGIAVDVFTNGQRITNDIKRLADYYPRLVGVSIYSGVAKDHDAITRIPGSWEKSMQVIRELYKLAVPMNLKCCVMQPNLHTYYMVADIAAEYGAVPQFEINITESNDGDICAKQLRLTEEQLQVVLRDNNLALYVGKEAPNYGGQKRDLSLCSCGAGGTGFCMSPNGDLRACPTFTQTYGNLKIQSIDEILTGSSLLKEWRSAVVADYTECGKYNYCDYCNLCAGVNYIEHGDFRKPAETNCFMAKCRYNLAKRLMEQNDTMTREKFIKALQKLPIEKVVLQRKYRK